MSKNLISILNASLNSGELLELVDESFSSSEVLEKLGFSKKGQYVTIVRDFLISNDVDISQFTPNGRPKVPPIIKTCLCCGKEFSAIKRSVKEQVTCSRACSNTYFRSGPNNGNYTDGINSYRNKALNYYGRICARCGFSVLEALEVHHIDRNRANNDITNLMVLCANCHILEHRGL